MSSVSQPTPSDLTSLSDPRPFPADGETFNRFTNELSQIYQHLLVSSSLEALGLPTPTTKHLSFSSPTPEIQKRYETHLLEPTPVGEVVKRYTTSAAGTEAVVFTLTKEELEQLKRVAQREIAAVQGEGTWISTQDALSAWWVDILRRAAGAPVSSVCNSANVSPSTKLYA